MAWKHAREGGADAGSALDLGGRLDDARRVGSERFGGRTSRQKRLQDATTFHRDHWYPAGSHRIAICRHSVPSTVVSLKNTTCVVLRMRSHPPGPQLLAFTRVRPKESIVSPSRPAARITLRAAVGVTGPAADACGPSDSRRAPAAVVRVPRRGRRGARRSAAARGA